MRQLRIVETILYYSKWRSSEQWRQLSSICGLICYSPICVHLAVKWISLLFGTEIFLELLYRKVTIPWHCFYSSNKLFNYKLVWSIRCQNYIVLTTVKMVFIFLFALYITLAFIIRNPLSPKSIEPVSIITIWYIIM